MKLSEGGLQTGIAGSSAGDVGLQGRTGAARRERMSAHKTE